MDAYLLPLAQAAAAYETSVVPWFQTSTCQVYLSTVLGHPCFVFGGTKTWREWIVDFMGLDVPFFQHPQVGPVHMGYWFDIQDALTAIVAYLVSKGWPPFLLAGHSKGAGEVILAHMALKLAGHTPLATRAYEPPRVGTTSLTSFLSTDDIAWTQTFNASGSDIVTMVPDWPEWEHQGVLTRLNVPAAYGISQKHDIPAVLAALAALPA